MRIVVDCDGVLGEFIPHLFKWLGTKRSPEEVVGWDFNHFITEDEKRLVRYILKDPDFWMTIPPVPNAQRAIEYLRAHHEVICVSSPWKGFDLWENCRRKWLKAYFDFHPRDFIPTGRKELIIGDVIIDDRPKNIELATCRPVLFDRPWNRTGVNRKDYARMYTWQLGEVNKTILNMEEISSIGTW